MNSAYPDLLIDLRDITLEDFENLDESCLAHALRRLFSSLDADRPTSASFLSVIVDDLP
ncbi:hypothetical protein [Actinomadura craniellae]|nr:hypothetical protein [Actinomadura craniellae]